MSTLTTFIRRLRPVDILLPIGAALVSAGLQNLADRERRSRGRLDYMATLAADHLDALRAAGVAVPDELAADEEHPLDPGVPWLSQHASADPDDDEPDATPTRRPWKLAALALLGAAGVTAYNHRDQLVATLFGVKTDLTPDEPDGPAPVWAGQLCQECGQPAAWIFEEQTWRHVVPPDGRTRWSSHAVVTEPAVNESSEPPADPETPAAPWPTPGEQVAACCSARALGMPFACITPSLCLNGERVVKLVDDDPVDELPEPDPEPLESCGWPTCTWTSDPSKSVISQGTAAAVHRNRCMYRPAGAAVSGT